MVDGNMLHRDEMHPKAATIAVAVTQLLNPIACYTTHISQGTICLSVEPFYTWIN